MNSYQQKTEEALRRMADDQRKTEVTIQRIVENVLQKALELLPKVHISVA